MPALHALLLTDVVDSTKLTEQLGDAAMAGLWATHDRIARDLLPLWRGREIDKTDGMLLLFDDVHDAVGYALAYHRALAARELPFKARAGIHVGPVSLRPNPPDDVARGAKPVEVDGLALPIAARVMAVALGAQTLLSADARLALGVLPVQRAGPHVDLQERPLRVLSHGHWRMHGVTDPVELFEIGESGPASSAPFVAPPDGAKVYRVMRQGDLWQPVREVRHSVPAERDSFVGRQEPLQLLAQKFEDGARLVSVLGMGGTGKTRLVTRFAWTVLGDYPGGVWFCDLSQARTVDGIHFAVAQGLDVALGKTEPVVQLAHAIAGRGKCLVIFDNFEQVARHAEETLGRWLDRAPNAQFLVTTREVLGIVGEETFALAPLPGLDAAALFVRRAESARQGYVPSADDAAAIEQLVKALDGLPLAIELAAARTRVMPPRVLLAKMHDRFSVLLSRAGRRDRQATLRAAFDWSWELLSEPEKAGLAQLSVFRGGFTLESAEAVLDTSRTASAPGWAPDVVQWLVDKSLVRQVSNERFDLLESVREYAAEHLRTEASHPGSGPLAQAATEQRHGRHFARAGGEWPHADLDNLVVACRRATASGDGATAVQALLWAWQVIKLRGPFRFAVDLAAEVRKGAGCDEAATARLELVAGGGLEVCGTAADSEKHFQRALAGARRVGDKGTEVRALMGISTLQGRRGQLDDADATCRLALSAAREVGDRGIECSLLNNLGMFCESRNRFDEARVLFEAALRIAREIGDRRWEGGSAGNLGALLANQGNLREARAQYGQAVTIARELDDRQWAANARCNLGLLHFTEKRIDEARIELEASLTAAREMGHTRLVAVVQCNLGLVAEAQGQPEDALVRYEEAVKIAQDLKDRRSVGQFLSYLGLLNARQGRALEARHCLEEGAAMLTAVADRVSLGILMCHRAEAEHLAGDPLAASATLAQAEHLASELSGSVEIESEFGQALQRVRSWSGIAA